MASFVWQKEKLVRLYFMNSALFKSHFPPATWHCMMRTLVYIVYVAHNELWHGNLPWDCDSQNETLIHISSYTSQEESGQRPCERCTGLFKARMTSLHTRVSIGVDHAEKMALLRETGATLFHQRERHPQHQAAASSSSQQRRSNPAMARQRTNERSISKWRAMR